MLIPIILAFAGLLALAFGILGFLLIVRGIMRLEDVKKGGYFTARGVMFIYTSMFFGFILFLCGLD